MTKPNLPIEKCTACGACASRCPRNAIKLSSDEEGFYIPSIDENLCIECKLCEKACHVLNVLHEEYKGGVPYMVKAHEKPLLKKSSSGGVFSLLSEVVMNEGGVVYGARYNYSTEILECLSTNDCNIEELRKSKYVESYMGTTFRSIVEKLKANRPVLFCGTPCQCRGLHHYLNTCKCSMEKLILVRFICHGVPSNLFFQDYKHYVEKQYKSKARYIDFRPKDFGWRTQNLRIEFENGKILKEKHTCNIYLKNFYSSDMLRKSCYECSCLNENCADLTIADFWGIHFFRPENKDQEGVSLVVCHSDKGQNYLNQIADKCEMEQLPSSAIEYIYKRGGFENKMINRPRLMERVRQEGYMPVALSLYEKECKKNKRIQFIKNIIKRFVLKGNAF